MKTNSINGLFRTVVLTCLTAACLLAVSGELSFAVERPAKVTRFKSVSVKLGKAVLTWQRVDCDGGYDIKYSTDKKFKKNKVVINGKPGSHKKTISKLIPGKRYYFRIRAYRWNKTRTSRIHGRWSKRKSCIVHKHMFKKSRIRSLVAGVKQYAYMCSCGKAYYKAAAKTGRKYNGILCKLPSCVPGEIKSSPTSAVQYIAPSKSHITVKDGEQHKCRRCGQLLNYVEHKVVDKKTGKTTKVKFVAPKNTCVTSSLAFAVKNSKGARYDYKLYYQKSDNLYYTYPKWKDYLKIHGCSTCVLTAVLNATVPKYKNYTPDRVLEEVIRPAVGKESFNYNFRKPLMKQMPIGLKGISKVLTANGVRNKYVYKYTKASAIKTITAHLRRGNPIIFYMSKSTLTPNTHAMVMLGLDKNGRVITGDTVHRSARAWGANNRLIKFNNTSDAKSTTVKNLCRFFTSSTNSIKNVKDFYNGKQGNNAFVLIYKDK